MQIHNFKSFDEMLASYKIKNTEEKTLFKKVYLHNTQKRLQEELDTKLMYLMSHPYVRIQGL